MDLKDLKPTNVKLKLSSTGREYTLRHISLADEIWIQEEFGDRFNEIFKEDSIDMVSLARIVFHHIEDKSDFIRKEVTLVNEEGEEEVHVLGGCKLLQTMITGMEDKIEMISAFNKVMIASRPDIKEQIEDVKKKTQLIGH